jgi:uncharacterized protein YebE (UPF0316 family)
MDYVFSGMNGPYFEFFLLPLLIFFARIIDVSIGTVRIVFVARGVKTLASLFAFFEILIWLVTIQQVLANISNPLHYIAYAGGFSFGTYIGMIIENKLSIGFVMLRIITARGGSELAKHLRERGFRVTDLDAFGNSGPVRIIFAVVKRAALPDLEARIRKFNPGAFYSIEDIRSISRSEFPSFGFRRTSFFKRFRKGK